MVSAAPAIAALVAFASAATVLGAFLLAAGRAPRSIAGGERLAIAFVLGVGTLGLITFLVGLRALGAPTSAGLLALAHAPLARRDVRVELRTTWTAAFARLSAGHAVSLAVMAFLGLAALARPVGDIGNDSISYHLLGPAVWLRAGRITPVLDHALTAFPVVLESVFAAGMSLSDDRFPALLGVACTAALVAQTASLARLLGAPRGWKTFAATAVSTAPVVVWTGPSAFVDVPYAALALAALRLALAARLSWRGAALAGAVLGLALGTKYTGLPLAAITLATLAWFHARSGSVARACSLAVLAGVVAAAVGSPFYLKNLVLLGCPIYPPPPALARLCSAVAFPYEASVRLQHYVAVERGSGFGRGPVDLLLLPWRFTLYTARFHGGGGIGLLPLALAPLGALVAWRRRGARAVGLWCGAFACVWFWTQQEARFLIPVICVSMAVATAGAAWLWGRSRAARGAVAAVTAISVAYGGAALAKLHAPNVHAALSPREDARRRAREVPHAPAWTFLNASPAVERVLLLDPALPPYYLQKHYVKVAGVYGERPLEGVASDAEALARAAELRVTHVLDVVANGAFRIRGDARTRGLRLAFDSPTARVYAVDSTVVGSRRDDPP